MSRGTIAMLMLAAAAVPLAGCGEKPQTAGGGPVKKSDAKGWEGSTTHLADGYKAGDKAAWEAHLKARTERGQNEYSHTIPAQK
jgi:hypothetical protein